MEVRKVVGFPGYWITDEAKVYSTREESTGRIVPWKWKEMAITIDGGYRTVGLCRGKKQYHRRVARMMLESFKGMPKKKGEHCRHLDGNPLNDTLENLAWGSCKDNMQDKVRHGRSSKGSKHHKTHMTEADVIRMRWAWMKGVSQLELAEIYGVTRRNVNSIIRRKTWTHI